MRYVVYLPRVSGLLKPGVIPSQYFCHQVIHCWAKGGKGTLGARKAEALLQEMQSLRKQYNDDSMAPNLVTFNCVLNAWALSGTRCCGRKAENYLDQMWELYNAGDNQLVKPNDKSYNTVSFPATTLRCLTLYQTIRCFIALY